MKRIRLQTYIMNRRCIEFCMRWQIPEKKFPPDDLAAVFLWFYKVSKLGSAQQQSSAQGQLRDLFNIAIRTRHISFIEKLVQTDLQSVKKICKISCNTFCKACRNNWRAGVDLFAKLFATNNHEACCCASELGEYCGRNFHPEALELCNGWKCQETVYTLAAVNAIKSANERSLQMALQGLQLPDDVHTVKTICNEWLSDKEIAIDDGDNSLKIIQRRDVIVKTYEARKVAQRNLFIANVPFPTDVAKFASLWL
jgi:hypothetical protein